MISITTAPSVVLRWSQLTVVMTINVEGNVQSMFLAVLRVSQNSYVKPCPSTNANRAFRPFCARDQEARAIGVEMTTLTDLWWFICEDGCVSDASSMKRRCSAAVIIAVVAVLRSWPVGAGLVDGEEVTVRRWGGWWRYGCPRSRISTDKIGGRVDHWPLR